MFWKCGTQYTSKFGKLSSGHRTGKGQFSFQSPKKGNAKECSNYHTIALISHSSKVILQILQARFEQYVNQELPDVQAGFRKDRGTRDQIVNTRWIIKKARVSEKYLFLYLDYSKAFDSVDHHKLWKIFQEMGIPIWPASWEICMQVKKQQLELDIEQQTGSIQIGKGVHQGCILSPCSFNLNAEYITQNARLDEAQAGIKVARRNINNLRYADIPI